MELVATLVVLVLMVAAYGAQLSIRLRWVPYSSSSWLTVAFSIAIAFAIAWPVLAESFGVFPASLLDAAETAIFGSNIRKLTTVILLGVAFAGFYGFKPPFSEFGKKR